MTLLVNGKRIVKIEKRGAFHVPFATAPAREACARPIGRRDAGGQPTRQPVTSAPRTARWFQAS